MKIKILIIEDEHNIRISLKENLVSEGFDVDDVVDASSALEKIKDIFYDILLVDYNLPEMNGLDFIKEASQISPKSMPIIITGYSSVEIAVEAMRMGAHDYLIKPVSIAELVKVINTAVDERAKIKVGQEKFLTMSPSDPIFKNINDDLFLGVVNRNKSRNGEAVKYSNPISDKISFLFKNIFRKVKAYFWNI